MGDTVQNPSKPDIFNPDKNYLRTRYIQLRPWCDFEIIESFDNQDYQRRLLLDVLSGSLDVAIGKGLGIEFINPSNPDTDIRVLPGYVYFKGMILRLKNPVVLSPISRKVDVYFECQRFQFTGDDDEDLLHPDIGRPNRYVAQREQWVPLIHSNPGGVSPSPIPPGKGTFLGRDIVKLMVVDTASHEITYSVNKSIGFGHVGSRGESEHGLATEEEAGFLSPEDKVILNNLSGYDKFSGMSVPFRVYEHWFKCLSTLPRLFSDEWSYFGYSYVGPWDVGYDVYPFGGINYHMIVGSNATRVYFVRVLNTSSQTKFLKVPIYAVDDVVRVHYGSEFNPPNFDGWQKAFVYYRHGELLMGGNDPRYGSSIKGCYFSVPVGGNQSMYVAIISGSTESPSFRLHMPSWITCVYDSRLRSLDIDGTPYNKDFVVSPDWIIWR